MSPRQHQPRDQAPTVRRGHAAGLVQPGGGILPPAPCHGPDVLVQLRAVGTHAVVKETGEGHPSRPEATTGRVRAAKGAVASPVRQGREGLLQEAAEHAATQQQAAIRVANRNAATVPARRRGRKNHPLHVPVPLDAHNAVHVGGG